MSVLGSVLLYVVAAVLVVLVDRSLRKKNRQPQSLDFNDTTLSFLVRDRRIIDTNFAGKRILNRSQGAVSDFEQLQLYLSQNFDAPDRLLTEDAGVNDVMAHSWDGQMQAIKHVTNETVRLTVHFVNGDIPATGDIFTLRAVEAELETLRANTAAAPFLLWRQNHAGDIVWVNQAYLNAAKKLAGVEETSWPLPVIFPSLRNLKAPIASESRRIAAPRWQDEPDAWYDCHISAVGKDILFTAVPADEAVRAENRRREFTQTLTKTFAELAIGLAIFDRSRRLVLFNPALLDLTNLPTDFLTSRPSLIGFLDQLRENRVMPEPRDYRSWRASIAELEAAAADGTYSETWSLPDGQTYHVTGRPHPDGAVALLFEDISAEMSLTRHFRSEIEQFQAVIDVFDDAVAIFTPAGEVAIMNQAYRDLWQINCEEFMVGDLAEATRRWHSLTAPTPVWGDFREFAQTDRDRVEWEATVALRDGRQLSCRFKPRPGGVTMAIFHVDKMSAETKLQTAV